MTLIVQEDGTLRTFTDNAYAQASFCWQYLLKNKEIKVNGVKVGKDMPVKKGDEVTYFLTAKQREKKAFHNLYEDEYFLIIDKESGVNAEAVYAQLCRTGEYYFIHRLDRNTQGLMAFAKTKKAEETLLAAFRDRRVDKQYECVCLGVPVPSQGILSAYLKKQGEASLVKVFDTPVSGAEKIVTEYVLQEEFCLSGERVSLLKVVLHTGKTHQIRAHLSHVGTPILGDMKYGDAAKNKQFRLERQRLVAKRLRLYLEGEFAYMAGKVFESRFSAKVGLEEKE